MQTERIEKSFDVASPANLIVHNIRGHVVVSPHEAEKINIIATVFLDSGDPDTTTIEMNQEKDGTVTIVSKYDKVQGFFNYHRPCRIDYQIFAPSACSVRSKLVSSNLEIFGFEGEFKFSSVSGDIKVSDLKGRMKIKTVSGRIFGDNLDGPATLGTVSGKVSATDSNFPSLDTSTVSGSATIHTPLGEGPYKLSSVSGAIRLVTSEDSNCSVHASGVSGNFRTDRNITGGFVSHRKWAVDFNGGGVVIEMKTVSGNMFLISDEDSRGSRPSHKKITKEDRLAILSKLDKGEISSEDALTQLQV